MKLVWEVNEDEKFRTLAGETQTALWVYKQ